METQTKTCPRCKGTIEGYPALSRRGPVDICNDCGTEEAMYDFALTKEGINYKLPLEVYGREHRFQKYVEALA